MNHLTKVAPKGFDWTLCARLLPLLPNPHIAFTFGPVRELVLIHNICAQTCGSIESGNFRFFSGWGSLNLFSERNYGVKSMKLSPSKDTVPSVVCGFHSFPIFPSLLSFLWRNKVMKIQAKKENQLKGSPSMFLFQLSNWVMHICIYLCPFLWLLLRFIHLRFCDFSERKLQGLEQRGTADWRFPPPQHSWPDCSTGGEYIILDFSDFYFFLFLLSFPILFPLNLKIGDTPTQNCQCSPITHTHLQWD